MIDDEKTMDPAASGEAFSKELGEEIRFDDLARTIRKGMEAYRTLPGGLSEPDWATRAKFAQMAINYRVGKPLERMEAGDARKEIESIEDLREVLTRSPKMLSAFRALLAEIDAG